MKNSIVSEDVEKLYLAISNVLISARSKIYNNINFTMVQSYWEIGKLIIENELDGKERAGYGKYIMKQLAARLNANFGKSFDERELRRICQFYRCFPIRDTLRPELAWSHYRRLISVENPHARQWYMNEAAASVWSTRQLDRQISSLYYERLLYM